MTQKESKFRSKLHKPWSRVGGSAGKAATVRSGGSVGQFFPIPPTTPLASLLRTQPLETCTMKIHEVFAYLRVKNAGKAVEFYSRAFGATEKFRLTEPSGRIGHAELDFGGTVIMLSEEYPEFELLGPETVGQTTVSIHLHVDNCDVMIERAVAQGAKLLREPSDAFYGERSGTVRDPFGHEWLIGHEIEKVEPDEMQRRYTELMNNTKSAS